MIAMNENPGEAAHTDDLNISNNAETMPSSESPSANSGLEDLTTQALRFLSQASPETLGAVAVGLSACTYIILGRLGLVLIGAFGGIVLHATWEGRDQSGSSGGDIRREKGVDIVHRILDLRSKATRIEEESEEEEVLGETFEGFKPETASALNSFVDAVMRDYVHWWYTPILPNDQTFPGAARQTLTRFILSISQHLSRKRPADTFLDFLTNSSSIVIVFLNELSNALSVSQGSNETPAEAVNTYLLENPDSNLANVLNGKQQAKKFKMVAEDILQTFLEKSAYACDPARLFLREVFAGLILESTLVTCSKPEWINGWIVYLLEEGEPDFNQALDAGMVPGNDILSSLGELDGNVGNIGVAKAPKSQIEKHHQETKRHQKRLSKAEEAMEEAMEEAKRLSQLIADEDAKRAPISQKPLDDTPKELLVAMENNTKTMNLDGAAFKSSEDSSIQKHSIASSGGLLDKSGVGPPSSNYREQSPVKDPAHNIRSSVSSVGAFSNGGHQKPSEAPLSPPSSISPTSTHSAFTSFDQLVPQSMPTALQEGAPVQRRKTVSLTLHNANIIIHDDSTIADKGKLRNKPNADYLVQIEPSSSDHPGWMIVRKYPDFETLHEVLRRIAQISGVKAFTEQHQVLPNWKEHTKASLRGELERYLRDACWYKELAESEGMKRFLEKDQGQPTNSKGGFSGLGWPTPSAFENMGKGMLDVLTNAPKGVAEGGKALGGGITGVFSNIGNLGQRKSATNGNGNVGTHTAGRSSTSTLPRVDSMSSMNSIMQTRAGRVSEDSLRSSLIVQTQPSMVPQMERRPSWNSIAEAEGDREPRASSARSSLSGRRSTTISRDPSRAPSRRGTPLSSPTQSTMDLRLPPPPSNMPDDYGSPVESKSGHFRTDSNMTATRTSTSTAPSQSPQGRPSLSGRRSSVQAPALARKPRGEYMPLTEPETRVAVELLFAVINELYTLSSAWNIRRTLLTAAKTFLLRPGNPSLTSIQNLIQDSVIVANTSDAGIAGHIKKLRENSLPTEEELRAWPPALTPEEKERLRIKARRLLVERGVPAALTGVMGQAATGEAMGRIFDCLQVEEVARGLMFGLLLQAVRAVTQ